MRLPIIVLLTTALISPCLSQNAVRNGNFEGGLAHWQRNHDFPTEAHVEVVERPDLGHCLQLTSDGVTVEYVQDIELEGGTYIFHVDMMRSVPGDDIAAYLIISRPTAGDRYHALGAGSTTVNRWEHLALRAWVPQDVSRSRVLLVNRAAGATAWFDNVEVVRLAATSGPTGDWSPKLGVPHLDVPSVDEAVQIDGNLSTGEWDRAARITGFGLIEDGARPTADTQAWIATTPTHLLIAARCHEPQMARATSETTESDDSGIFRDEVLEIFIDANNNRETYYHLAVNSIGTIYDSSRGEGPIEGTDFQSGMIAAASRDDDGWTVEIAIPLSRLTIADSGDIWGFNIARQRYVPDGRENSAWSATGRRFHVPARFGHIVGLGHASRPAVTAQFAGVDDPTPGLSQMRFVLESDTDEDMPLIVRAKVATPDNILRTTEAQTTVPRGSEREVRIPLQLDTRGTWLVSADLLELSTDALIDVVATQRLVVPPVLQARIAKPWYRGRIFTSMDLDAIEVEAHVGIRAPDDQDLRLVGRIVGDNGVMEVARTRVDDPVSTLQIPCGGLPWGAYTVDIQLVGGGTEVLATIRDLPLEKLPPADTEIWFDRENNMLINGRPHFPTGFYAMDHPDLAEEVAAAGYTYYHTYRSSRPATLVPTPGGARDWQRYFDAGAEQGLRTFIGIGQVGDHGEEDFHERLLKGEADESKRIMTEFIERWKDHPALGAWYLYDEPILRGRTVEEIRYLYEMVDSRDPYHPKVICQVRWSDGRLVELLDVLMPDPYPIRADRARPLTMVSDAVRSARNTVADEKPVWAVLQWYGYPEGRFPTADELRCMAFLALAAEAKGILWYSFHHGYTRDREQWEAMQRLGRELRACEDVVLAPRARIGHTVPADAGVASLLKRGHDGKLHLIVVNPEGQPVEGVAVTLERRIVTAVDRLSGHAAAFDGDTLSLDLAPYQPVVLDIEMEQ